MNKTQQLKLMKLANFSGRPGPVLLIIMDGVGMGKPGPQNAFFQAKTPNLDRLFKNSMYTTLKAHGVSVGLPSDQDMGNSEVGHNALGAGRVFAQGAKLVDQAIESRSLYQGAVWNTLMSQGKANKLHFIGLLSDGNVHSHIDQLLALVRQAAKEGVMQVCIHPLLDGRDVFEKSALTYIQKIEDLLKGINQNDGFDYRIASGGGRMVTTMDRYFADWNVVKNGWDAQVHGKGRQFSSATAAIETYYQEDEAITDQYLPAFVVKKNGKPVGKIEDGDAVLFFNFRGDRAIEISMAFDQTSFSGFDRGRCPDVYYAGMMQYDGDLNIPKHYVVSPPCIDRTMSHYLCAEKVYSFALSETQKFGHVTYFWNGNKSGYIDERYETYVEIPSDNIRFDEKPEMKADDITQTAIKLLTSGKYQFGRLNFPNGDMVGHTGNIDAAIQAMEKVDECVGELVSVVNQLKGVTVITADHGNCDEMYTVKLDGTVSKVTSHTLNPVPFLIVDSLYQGDYHLSDIDQPGLVNVAATLCNLLGYQAPADYCESLIQF